MLPRYALGDLLGVAVRQGPAKVVVADPGRRGRSDFLKAFRDASGRSDARFIDTPVPDHCVDIFDGRSQSTVGVLDPGRA